MMLPTLPTRTAPLVAGDGLISQVWYTFLNALWKLLGGLSGLVSSGPVYFDGNSIFSLSLSYGGQGPLDPAGTTSSTPVMMGIDQLIGFSIESFAMVTVCGEGANTSGGDGFTVSLRYGAWPPFPANGAAATGTVVCSQTASNVNANAKIPFSITGLAGGTGFVANDAYWLDISLSADGGGTATLTDVYITFLQLPSFPGMG